MLTAREVAAAKSARWFDDLSWGRVGVGLSPEGKVAQVRGVRFTRVGAR